MQSLDKRKKWFRQGREDRKGPGEGSREGSREGSGEGKVQKKVQGKKGKESSKEMSKVRKGRPKLREGRGRRD